MSQHEPENTEDVTEEEPEIALADPDDYHRQQRLKEIHRRRQQVAKTLDQIERFTKKKEHALNKTDLADAVSLYITELEPLIEHTEESPELSRLPWDSVHEYADHMGACEQDGEMAAAPYEYHLYVFRACNRYLGRVKPLIEEDDTDEWEV